MSRISGSLNFLELSGPAQTCVTIALLTSICSEEELITATETYVRMAGLRPRVQTYASRIRNRSDIHLTYLFDVCSSSRGTIDYIYL